MNAIATVDDDLDAILLKLNAALRRRYGAGADIDAVDVATLGGSNRTLLFDLVEGSARRRLVLRQETCTFPHSPFLPPHLQYELLRLAYAQGVPVPEPAFELDGEDGLGRGYVMAHMAGETLPKTLLHDPAFAEARAVYVSQAGTILARLHAIDPKAAAVVADVPDSRDPLHAQFEHYLHYGEAHPALEFAFRWLERERPPSGHKVLLHGDFRNGNMIVGPEGIRALLDWECAHLGDPLEDLGWFCTRSWRFGNVEQHAGGFAPREAFYAAYEAAGGRLVDRTTARWWEVFGLLRWALFNVMQIYGHLGGRRSPAYAACGRNTCLIEYDLLMTIAGRFD